jgi:hypothetical protein
MFDKTVHNAFIDFFLITNILKGFFLILILANTTIKKTIKKTNLVKKYFQNYILESKLN